jgi:hypothetical protein
LNRNPIFLKMEFESPEWPKDFGTAGEEDIHEVYPGT